MLVVALNDSLALTLTLLSCTYPTSCHLIFLPSHAVKAFFAPAEIYSILSLNGWNSNVLHSITTGVYVILKETQQYSKDDPPQFVPVTCK